MGQQHDTEATLRAIRELMNSSNKSSSLEEEILELSEDDLIDEEDKEAFLNERLPNKADKINEINELLTKIKDPNIIEFDNGVSKDVSAENAARSIEIIKAILKRAENNPNSSKFVKSQSSLDELVIEALKPVLLDWSEDKLKSIIKPIVEKEVKKYFLKNQGSQ